MRVVRFYQSACPPTPPPRLAVLLAVLPPAFQGSWARALRVARGARRELEAEDFRELLERPQGAEDLQDELGGVEPVVMGLNSV